MKATKDNWYIQLTEENKELVIDQIMNGIYHENCDGENTYYGVINGDTDWCNGNEYFKDKNIPLATESDLRKMYNIPEENKPSGKIIGYRIVKWFPITEGFRKNIELLWEREGYHVPHTSTLFDKEWLQNTEFFEPVYEKYQVNYICNRGNMVEIYKDDTITLYSKQQKVALLSVEDLEEIIQLFKS